jgi:hypothetical protein
MRRLPAVLLLLALTGCSGTSVRGPFSRPNSRPDDPIYSLEEQKARGREAYSLPEDDSRYAPNAYINRYGPTGASGGYRIR